MSLFQVGRLCVKTAGRDAGRKCVVIESIDANFVVIDGNTRRKKVNIKHLEPLDKILEIKSKAASDEVKKAFAKLGLAVWERKSRKTVARVKKTKVKKEAKPLKGKKAKVEKKKPVQPAEKIPLAAKN